ncbi:MAG: ATP synthase F1 subunit delta, partial [Dehalococcoidales bacterium]|nr:ATP synthase F1 subunit delta [Dehalococcoidales bacterium]
ARRYAQAIFRMALENKEINRWQSDLRKTASLLDDRALFSMVTDNKIAVGEKTRVLSQRLGEVNPLALKLVLVLGAKGKLAFMEDISDEYQRLVDNYRGIEGTEIAEVTTAIPLDDDYQLKVAQRITEIIGKPVVLKPRVDPGIIGGIVIRVGDKLIDGSIRTKLAALRKDLGGVAK